MLRVGDNEAAKALRSQFFVTNEENLPARLNVPPLPPHVTHPT